MPRKVILREGVHWIWMLGTSLFTISFGVAEKGGVFYIRAFIRVGCHLQQYSKEVFYTCSVCGFSVGCGW